MCTFAEEYKIVQGIQPRTTNGGFNSDWVSLKNAEKAIKANEEYIKLETLTKNIKFVEKIENGIEIEFDSIISKIIFRI